MTFNQIGGGSRIVEALAGMVDTGKVPHAIMFHEDDGGGAVPLALAFLQYLMCRSRKDGDSCGECPSCNRISKMIHPDVHFVYPVTGGTSAADYLARWRELVISNPGFTRENVEEAFGMEGKSPAISVGQVKELLDTLSLAALEGGYRCVVVYLPELMNAEAGNRLLKLIEEPPALTQFLLVTHAPEKVLVTIRSRCQTLRVLPLEFASAAPSAPGASAEQNMRLVDELMEALLARDLSAALEVGEEIASLPSRERQKGFCIFASETLRRIFLLQQGMDALARIPEGQKGKYNGWAGKLSKKFPRKALEAFSRAERLIDRNVASKLVFTDLVVRLAPAV